MNGEDYEPLVATIPADIEQPDKVLAGQTARQVLILGITGLLTVWLYLLIASLLPLLVVMLVLLPVVAAGSALALGRRDGLGLDRFAWLGITHWPRRKTQVAAPEGVEALPRWCRIRGQLPAPLRLPVRAIREDGVMELADGGMAAIVRAGTISFGLRTAAEQASLVAFLGRWLNSLDASVQILIQTRCADLSGLSAQVGVAAAQLPHPALERAALAHADFLLELSRSRELLTREVLIVIRDQPGGDRRKTGGGDGARNASAAVVLRRAEETERALTAIGISVEALDATACTRVLIDALSPGQARPPGGIPDPDQPITSALSMDEGAAQ
ncbi:PrgI family protein [Actinomadura sp. B10D3]|uniref:PrgI family protein n=1 Tax=Actinomadura sp. B10D3 TaxID=3153557 RepID=UPI00325E1D80